MYSILHVGPYLHYHVLWVTPKNKVIAISREFYATESDARRAGDLTERLYMIQGCNKDCKEGG